MYIQNINSVASDYISANDGIDTFPIIFHKGLGQPVNGLRATFKFIRL